MEKVAGIRRRLCKTTRANWGSVWSPADVWGYEKTGRHIVCLPVLKAGSRPPGQGADNKQGAQHQHKADDPGDVYVLDKARHNEAHHADAGHR